MYGLTKKPGAATLLAAIMATIAASTIVLPAAASPVPRVKPAASAVTRTAGEAPKSDKLRLTIRTAHGTKTIIDNGNGTKTIILRSKDGQLIRAYSEKKGSSFKMNSLTSGPGARKVGKAVPAPGYILVKAKR
ncbi:hypothetical protein GGD81_000965 [Rhodobium orientis]|uniref:Uncharacterized protein n=1 Tax=Rhodobium orientis TaxID=34017 RepID=A0A327JPG2_9HYPH|nr:hypothetical protein [Rhodobium orientis]MBB4301941.1 hypothetical protein [Rhodobium orientis]MBK5950178.1 hypothetical protein [Rhodobium orientis]RAI27244.1 hypothetical protein CH339_10895 [Rhodobium orientis]